MDSYYSVESFRAAYDGRIPAIPDKSIWPKVEHGFFMHPPLLKPTAGRRRQKRNKGAVEGSSKGANISVQSVSNMDIIGTLVRMVIQQI